MQIFLDTADINEVQELAATGLINGITTNPSLAAVAGMSFCEMIQEMCRLVDGPISAEVVAPDADTMVKQGEKLAKISDNVVIKVPLTMEGLKACDRLTDNQIPVNVTLCFSLNQAILAANAGATFISPFLGRLDDIGQDGCALIAEIRQYYTQQMYDTQILAASIRDVNHVKRVALLGADAVTMPPKIFRQMYHHELTDKGLERFESDWIKSGLSI